MRVQNMTSSKGNKVANQFIITDDDGSEIFQSYDTIIAKIQGQDLFLDEREWNCSNTTLKYLHIFLGIDTKEIKKQIKEGTITLLDLNNN